MRDEYGGEPGRILAAQVRALREKLGMTQGGVAKEMTARGITMRQSTIAKIEANQRPVYVNEAVMLAAILGTDLADLVTDPRQRDMRDALATARGEEREMLGQLIQATRRLEDHRASRVAAEHAVRDAERKVEELQGRYTQAQHLAESLAATGNERGESD